MSPAAEPGTTWEMASGGTLTPRRSITNAIGGALAVVTRPSKKNTRAVATKPRKDQEIWAVGCKYAVGKDVELWSEPELVGEKVRDLKAKDVVTLLAVLPPSLDTKECRYCHIGLVAPLNADHTGWMALEDPPSIKGPQPLVKRRLPGSWEVKARYPVKESATLRASIELKSDKLGELVKGEEVLVLDLDCNLNERGQRARLRMQVSTDRGVIGWISPETSKGERLIEPTNMLSAQAVEVHKRRRSLSGNSPSTLMSSVIKITSLKPRDSKTAAAPLSPGNNGEVPGSLDEYSYRPGGDIPWEVGGQYRALEKLSVREKPLLTSKETGKISAGALLNVLDMHNVECAQLGWCPVALVIVDSGPEKGRKGWVRCAAKAGHELVDTRNQHEFAKVMSKLENERFLQSAEPDSPESEEEESEESEEDDAASQSSTDEPQSLPEVTPQELPLMHPTAPPSLPPSKTKAVVASNPSCLAGCFLFACKPKRQAPPPKGK